EKAGPAAQEAGAGRKMLKPVIEGAFKAMKFVADHIDTIVGLLPALVLAYAAYKAAQVAINAAMALSVPLRLAEIAATRAQTKQLAALTTAQLASNTATGAGNTATAASAVAAGKA